MESEGKRMIVKQGKKHFEGENGVYYIPEKDEIWAVSGKEFTIIFDGKCLRTYHKYHAQTLNFITNEKVVITGDALMFYVGEL